MRLLALLGFIVLPLSGCSEMPEPTVWVVSMDRPAGLCLDERWRPLPDDECGRDCQEPTIWLGTDTVRYRGGSHSFDDAWAVFVFTEEKDDQCRLQEHVVTRPDAGRLLVKDGEYRYPFTMHANGTLETPYGRWVTPQTHASFPGEWWEPHVDEEAADWPASSHLWHRGALSASSLVAI